MYFTQSSKPRWAKLPNFLYCQESFVRCSRLQFGLLPPTGELHRKTQQSTKGAGSKSTLGFQKKKNAKRINLRLKGFLVRQKKTTQAAFQPSNECSGSRWGKQFRSACSPRNPGRSFMQLDHPLQVVKNSLESIKTIKKPKTIKQYPSKTLQDHQKRLSKTTQNHSNIKNHSSKPLTTIQTLPKNLKINTNKNL